MMNRVRHSLLGMPFRRTINHVVLSMALASSCIAAELVVTGHRGASAVAPENTLAAFRQAWQEGADAVEGDFRLTLDNQIVCIHDANTQRVTGTARTVADCTLAELRQLDYGSWKNARFAGETCPTFTEVFGTLPKDGRFFVELKTGPEIVSPLKAEIERLPTGSAEQLILIAFDLETVLACKRLLPTITTHWLTSFRETKKGSGKWRPTAAEIATTVSRLGVDGVGLQANQEQLTDHFFQELQAGGVQQVHVWTVDQPQAAAFFRAQGVMGITTNRPAAIKKSLRLP